MCIPNFFDLFSLFFYSHGWAKTSYKDIRYFGSFANSFYTKSLAYGEIDLQCLSCIGNAPSTVFCKIMVTSMELNGRLPESLYNIKYTYSRE